MILFTHIPKTAGASMHFSIVKNFSRPFSGEEIRRECSVISMLDRYINGGHKLRYAYAHGHFPYGIDKIFAGPIYYVVILRDPLRRTISSIQHSFSTRLRSSNSLFNEIVSQSRDVYELLNGFIENDIGCNCMVKQMSGLVDPNNIYLSSGKYVEGSFFPACFRTIIPYSNKQMKTIFRTSVDNLRDYSFVGFQEHFDKSLHKLVKLFKLEVRRQKVRHKKTRMHIKIDLDDGRTRDLPEEMNKYDMLFYNEAKKHRSKRRKSKRKRYEFLNPGRE